MKKLFTLVFAALLASGMYAQTTVTNKTELTAAFNAAATLSAGDISVVFVKGDINLGSLTLAQTTRNIHFIGINNEETGEQSTIRAELKFPEDNTEGDKFGLTFENLRLTVPNGVWRDSKYFISFKDAKTHFIDTIAFRGCEITDFSRAWMRGQIDGAPTDGTYKGCGLLNYFEMSDCVVHNGLRMNNAFPLVYVAWSTNKMVFKNNTFYDLTYMNSIVTFAYMTEDTGRQPVNFIFENNTVCAWSKSTLLSFGDYVTGESEFHIKNNIILQPNWADDKNGRFGDTSGDHESMAVMEGPNGLLDADSIQRRIDKGIVLTNILGGLVQQENNLLYGYKYQNLNPAIEENLVFPIGDTENEDGEFSSLSLEDVPFAWTDFADAQNDFFQISFDNPAYTAGKNGAPLGDTNNYTNQVIKVVTVKVTVAGSKSAKVTVSPEKAAYMTGDEITLTANCNGSLNTFKGWSNGMTEPVITITLENDLDITANFQEIDYYAVWNLDQITTNNVVMTPPVATNYGGGMTIDYARYINEEGEYVLESSGNIVYPTDENGKNPLYDGAKKAIQTRNNKVSGDVRNCFIIQTPSTQFYAEAEGKADYLIINVNEALAASKLQFFVASDNVPYNKYIVSYTTDGTTWTEAGTFDMEGKTQTNEWYQVEINLPELAQGSQIRIKGDETSGVTLTGDMQAMRDADPDMSLEDIGVATEFLFIAEIIIAPASGEQPKAKGDVNGDNAVDVADISSIITVMAAGGNDPAADVNHDGAVDVADISSVISIMAGGE